MLRLLWCLALSMGLMSGAAQPEEPPPVYVSVVMHNEEPRSGIYPDFVNDEAAYWQHRAKVVQFARMLHDHGVQFNYQSDWNFLQAMARYDAGTPETNGKNLLRYLHEDLGFAVDPHAHESRYNYADVAYLIELNGVETSHIAGGFLAAPPADSKLEYLWEPLTGVQYPDYTWQAEVLWGGATSGHRAEEALWAAGVWKPQDAEHFMTHDAEAPLPHIGNYGLRWRNLYELLQRQQNGELEPGRLYTTTVFAGQIEAVEQPRYLADFAREIERANEIGHIEWVQLGTVADLWETQYNAQPTILRYPRTATLEVDIQYDDRFYTEWFNYSREAENIRHYVLIVPAAETREIGRPGSIFLDFEFPPPGSNAIFLEADSEWGWALPYVYPAPRAHLTVTLEPGTYRVATAFIAATLSREEADVDEDASLWPGITGGGASTEFRQVTLEADATTTLTFRMDDNDGWACPWLYVYNGDAFEHRTEIIRNQRGATNEATETTAIGHVPVIDGAVVLRIAEEKQETSYLDELYIVLDGQRVDADRMPALNARDGDYLVMGPGEAAELRFVLPTGIEGLVDLEVVATGYYVEKTN